MSAASVSRWRKLEREQGDPTPGALGGDRRSQGIERHGAAILDIVAANRDVTLAEIKTALEARGVSTSIGGLWRFFDRHKITLKKVGARQRAGSRRHPEAPRGLVRRSGKARASRSAIPDGARPSPAA